MILPRSILMKYPFCLLFCLTAGLSLAGEDTPVEQVQKAVRNLEAASGYSWVVTAKAGDNSRSFPGPGPVEGRTEKGGVIHWMMSFGDHKAEAFVKGCNVAVKSGETWVKPEEIKLPPGPPPPPPGKQAPGSPPAPPPRPGNKSNHNTGSNASASPSECPPEGERSPGGRGKSGQESSGRKQKDGGKRSSFLARRLQEMKAPAEFAGDLAGKITGVTGSGDTFTGALSTEAARDLLTFGSRPKGQGHGFPELSNPGGTVSFTVKEGMLARLELRLTATMCLNGSDVSIDRTTQFDIANIGTAKLEIPEAAKAILDAPAAAPAPVP